MGRTYCEHLTPGDMDCPECDAVMASAWETKVAQIKAEERERIITLLSHRPFYVMDGPNNIIEGKRLRAALEPK